MAEAAVLAANCMPASSMFGGQNICCVSELNMKKSCSGRVAFKIFAAVAMHRHTATVRPTMEGCTAAAAAAADSGRLVAG